MKKFLTALALACVCAAAPASANVVDDHKNMCEMDGGHWHRVGTHWECSYSNGDAIACRWNAWHSGLVCRLQRARG